MRENEIRISAIIPVFNAKSHIEYFAGRLAETLQKTGSNFEMIFVNDGSNDGTLEQLSRLAQEDKRLKLVSQPDNRGQYHAINKGLALARGEILIIMDDDQEYALEYVPLLLKEINSGADLALGWRIKRKIAPWRNLGSRMINLILSILIGKRVHDLGGIKVFGNRGASVLRSRASLLGSVRFFGHFRIIQIKMDDRSCRTSRYNFKKLLLLFIQIISAQLRGTKADFKKGG